MLCILRCLEISRKLGNQRNIANSLNNLGNATREQGDFVSARKLYQECLTILRHLEEYGNAANALNNLGAIATLEHNYSEARSLHEQSLAMSRDLGNRSGIANSLIALGDTAYEQNDSVAARRLYLECLQIRFEIGDQRGIAATLEGLARSTSTDSQEQAVILWSAAASLRERIGAPISSIDQQQSSDQWSSHKDSLSDTAFDAAWTKGQSMTIELACNYALSMDN